VYKCVEKLNANGGDIRGVDVTCFFFVCYCWWIQFKILHITNMHTRVQPMS